MQYDASSSVILVVVGTLILCVCLRLINSHQNVYSPDHLKRGAILVKQAIQWHHVAEQDDDPMLASKHANYAVAYLNAARAILPDNVLEQVAKVNVHAFTDTLEESQRSRFASLDAECKPATAAASAAVTWMRV